tara:strand:+ start:6779 stop:8089 length:1311 start_codon:yes stop_codon:yes gene_type:complete
MDNIDRYKKTLSTITKKDDLYNSLWMSVTNKKIQRSNYHNIRIGLFNVPCGGFGDIIVTKTFHDYLKEWYPTANISICTTGPQKYKDLGLKNTKIYHMVRKDGSTWDDGECSGYHELKMVNKSVKFDIMIVIPIINYVFNIKKFKKLISYANVFNTFSVSEYNGEFPPYTFPIGVGKGQLGLLFNRFPTKQQNLIKAPYALVYIQPSPAWGVHSKYCFLSYLEMICKNYQKHTNFQIVIPKWIFETLDENYNFMLETKKIIKKFYGIFSIVSPDKEKYILDKNEKKKGELILRADILPQKREIFISLMKDSVKDILVTGDQSLTDIISCCKYKRVWYQIAPWKKGLAENLHKHLPNEYYGTYKTSCGTLKSINTEIDWRNFMKNYDFRIHGKKRMDSILIANSYYMKDNTYKEIAEAIEKSRYLETAKEKINKILN